MKIYVEHLSVMEIEKKELHVHKNIHSFEVIANQGRIEQVHCELHYKCDTLHTNKEEIIISTIDEKNRIKVCIENKGTQLKKSN